MRILRWVIDIRVDRDMLKGQITHTSAFWRNLRAKRGASSDTASTKSGQCYYQRGWRSRRTTEALIWVNCTLTPLTSVLSTTSTLPSLCLSHISQRGTESQQITRTEITGAFVPSSLLSWTDTNEQRAMSHNIKQQRLRHFTCLCRLARSQS